MVFRNPLAQVIYLIIETYISIRVTGFTVSGFWSSIPVRPSSFSRIVFMFRRPSVPISLSSRYRSIETSAPLTKVETLSSGS